MDARTPDELLRALCEGAPPSRPVLLAAHPDDDVVGASFALSERWRVVYLTDGAPEDARLRSGDAPPSREAYARLRRAEAFAALREVGIDASRVCFLDAVDQAAMDHVERWSFLLAERLAEWNADLLLAHPYEGGHPDHDAAALVAHLAAWRLSRAGRRIQLAEMSSYFRWAGALATGAFLPETETQRSPDGAMHEQVRLIPSATLRARKRRQFGLHGSQRAVLALFDPERPERFRLAPRYDFTRPPHEGTLHYESLGWLSGDTWRNRARLALRALEIEEGPWL